MPCAFVPFLSRAGELRWATRGATPDLRAIFKTWRKRSSMIARVGDHEGRADAATVRCRVNPMHRLEQHAEDLPGTLHSGAARRLRSLGTCFKRPCQPSSTKSATSAVMGPGGGAVAVCSANSAAQSSMKEQDMPPAEPEAERVARHSANEG